MRVGLGAKLAFASAIAVLVALLATGVVVTLVWPGVVRAPVWWQLAGIAAAVGAVTVLALMLVVRWWLLRPLSRVLLAMQGVREGGGAYPLPRARGLDETAILTDGYNRLTYKAVQNTQELAEAREAAAAASLAKAQFLAVMSHELRTPLNAVLGMAELLHSTRLDARQQRFVEQIRTSGRALLEIVDDVLDLTRLESGRLEIAAQPFRLRDAVFDTADLFRDSAHARAVELTVHVDPDLPAVVRGDVVHLRQILTNLLSNAVKFTEHGSVVVRVTPSNDRLRFSVSDTGVGIDSDFLPHIYEAFRQADSSPTRRFGGAGLGLSIARRLCEAMGGLIDVSSRPGKGSTFWFELPLPEEAGGLPHAMIEEAILALPVASPEAGDVGAAGDAAVHGSAAVPTGTVLLVEDDAPTRRQIGAALASSGYRLRLATNGAEAVQVLQREPVQLVLLDWQLPELEASAVLAAVRGATASSPTPVIALSSNIGPGDREACLAAGADAYLAKPFSDAELLNQVDSCASRAQRGT